MRPGLPAALAVTVATALLAPLLLASSAHAADVKPLVQVLLSDPSFKVRLQAARILVRRSEATEVPLSAEAVEAFRSAARADDSPIVRGFAIRALGELADPSDEALFDALAANDPDPFVREQAEAARAVWAARLAAAPLLVLAADPWTPGVDDDRTDELRETLRLQAEAQAGRRFRVGSSEDGRGFLLRASVAGLETRREADREIVTLDLQLVLATWPEQNLRQIVTARASAKVAPSYARRDRLQQRLLEDAMRRAVTDALADLEGS